MKKRIVMLLACCIVLCGCADAAVTDIIPVLNESENGTLNDKRIEGNGFDSPEDVLSAYIEALNDGDIDGMLAAYAIESYIDNVSTRADIERKSCFAPNSPFSVTYELSDGSDFDRNIRIKEREAYIMKRYYDMLSQQTIHHNMQTIGPLDDEGVDEFMDDIEENDFLNAWKKMKFVKFISPNELCKEYNSEANQKNISYQKKIYGCEDIENICALVKIDGKKYYQFAECVMYDGKWYIGSLAGNLPAIMGVSTDCWGLVECSADWLRVE